MKRYSKYMALAALCFAAYTANAECTVNLAVLPSPQAEDVPQATVNYLNTRLEQLATAEGIIADPSMGQFFLTAKFSHILEDVVPGPPAQTALHTNLTLYIGDINAETVYATTTLDLRGVGTSAQRAYINALRGVSPRNREITAFINKGKQKIIDYYNKNYRQIIATADRAAAQHNYEEALWRLSFIPECSVGYGEAMTVIQKYFQAYINQEGTSLLNAAMAAWAAEPDANGAAKAMAFLMGIDPESTAYPGAQKLMAEIKASVKSDRDFELREKYHDRVETERRRIDAAREVGVAWGRGQQPTTTNLMWLR